MRRVTRACCRPPRPNYLLFRKMHAPAAAATPSAPQASYIDSHTHLLSILQKMNMPPERYPDLRKEFPSTYYGCVNVACVLNILCPSNQHSCEPETFQDNVQFLKYDGGQYFTCVSLRSVSYSCGCIRSSSSSSKGLQRPGAPTRVKIISSPCTGRRMAKGHHEAP